MITVLSNVAARQDYGTDDRGGSPHFRDGTLAPCRYTHQDRDKDKEARTGDRLPNDSGRRDVTSQYPCSSTIWQRYQNKHDAPRGKPYEPNSDFNQELDHRCDDSRFTQQERWNVRDNRVVGVDCPLRNRLATPTSVHRMVLWSPRTGRMSKVRRPEFRSKDGR